MHSRNFYPANSHQKQPTSNWNHHSSSAPKSYQNSASNYDTSSNLQNFHSQQQKPKPAYHSDNSFSLKSSQNPAYYDSEISYSQSYQNPAYNHHTSLNSQYHQNSYPQQQYQMNIQTTKQEVVGTKKLLYFMEAAYSRVIASFNDLLESHTATFKDPQEIDTDTLRLNLLIDNAHAQFQSVQKQFPENYWTEFEKTLEEMQKDAEKFYKSISPDTAKALEPCFERLHLLLTLQLKELTEIEEVKEIDPHKVLILHQEIQKRYAEQERDFQKFEKDMDVNVTLPKFDSKPDVSNNFNMR